MEHQLKISRLVSFVFLLTLISQSISGVGTDLRAIQDAAAQNAVLATQSSTGAIGNAIFDHQAQLNNPGAVANYASSPNKTADIIKARRQAMMKKGLVKIDKNSSPEDIAASCGVVLVIGLIMVIIFWAFRSMTDYIEESLLYSINHISRDMIFIIFIITIFYILSLYNILDEFRKYVDVEGIAVFMLIAMFAWSVLGLLKILYLQTELNSYDLYEAEFTERGDLIERYVYLLEHKKNTKKLTREEQKILAVLQEQMVYYTFKMDFIQPSFLPTVSETFFSEEFPFSEYIGLAFGKTLKQYLQLKNSSYLVTLIIIFITLIYSNVIEEFIILPVLITVPILFTIFVYCQRRKVSGIYGQVYSKEKASEMIVFTNLAVNRAKGFDLNFYPAFLKQEYDTKGNAPKFPPNKQEMLFIFNNPKALLTFIHVGELGLIIWLTGNAPILWNIGGAMPWVYIGSIQAVWVTCAILVSIVFVPRMLKEYTFCSKVVMLRDFNLASLAIQNQKDRLKSSYKKFYR